MLSRATTIYCHYYYCCCCCHRLAGKGRSIAPRWPQLTACLQRWTGGIVGCCHSRSGQPICYDDDWDGDATGCLVVSLETDCYYYYKIILRVKLLWFTVEWKQTPSLETYDVCLQSSRTPQLDVHQLQRATVGNQAIMLRCLSNCLIITATFPLLVLGCEQFGSRHCCVWHIFTVPPRTSNIFL